MKGSRTSPYARLDPGGHDRRVVSLRLGPDTIALVNEKAAEAGVTPSEWIRAVLAEELGLQRWRA